MTDIILIETSTALCSAALSRDGKVISYKESSTPHSHASLTAPFIKEILDENSLAVGDCKAVCVSKGPGSYTGLRVGVSTAKGLCFGSGIPLLSLGTLDVLAWQAITENLLPEGCRYIVPLVDARRMEVYTAVFQTDGTRKTETAPVIVDGGSFTDILSEGPVLFIGDAADKCRDVILGENAHFVQCCPKASSMAIPATKAFQDGLFEDTAYFEPFYLKDFIATKPKKNLF
jgi:tRNA threonylcarbamoyladenosine biosynthesis protein TsaB